MIKDIIHINDYATINGGSSKVAIDGAIGLAELGYKVTFIAISGPVNEELLAANIDVRCMNQPDIWNEPDRARAMVRGLWNSGAMDFVRRQLADFDPRNSIIHCQGYTRALSPAIGKLMVESGFVNVFTAHDFMLACPNGTFFHHREKQICTRKPLGLSCLTTNCDARAPHHKAWRVARQLAGLKIARMPREFQDVIYISEVQRRALEPYMNPRTRLHLVPDPIPVSKEPRIRAEDNDLFVCIARLVPEKGCVLFAEAARAAGVKAVFVGDGPEREAILRANPDAHITGWVDPAGVVEWLGKTRCLVFPSIWYETFGMVAREAMAKGVPVICGDWNAATEGLTHGRNALVVASKEIADWRTAIERMKGAKVDEYSQAAYSDYWESAVGRVEHARLLVNVYEEAFSRQKQESCQC